MKEPTHNPPSFPEALGFAPVALLIILLYSGLEGPIGTLLFIIFLTGAVGCCFAAVSVFIRRDARFVVTVALVGVLVFLWDTSRKDSSAWAWPLFLVTLVCWFASSFVLFRNKKVWGIVAGLALSLLNGTIAFWTGFVALGLKW